MPFVILGIFVALIVVACIYLKSDKIGISCGGYSRRKVGHGVVQQKTHAARHEQRSVAKPTNAGCMTLKNPLDPIGIRQDFNTRMPGVAEQIRRLGGIPSKCTTWEEAEAYMKDLAGVDEIPRVYNLVRPISNRLAKKIIRLGGCPHSNWTDFEAKIYIQKLEHGKREFHPIISDCPPDEYVEWFYWKSDSWEKDVRELTTSHFLKGVKYPPVEIPPLASPIVAECVGVSSNKVTFRHPEWTDKDDETISIKVKGGVDIAGNYRADRIIEERPMQEKRKLLCWNVELPTEIGNG